jgi:hypothetical protein
MDNLFQDVKRYQNGQDLNGVFAFIKKFRNVAPFNAFLLHVQKPGSAYVATAAEWFTKFKRKVKPKERPLVILQPFGPVSFVFELSDTEGDEPFPDELLKPFKIEGRFLTQQITRHLFQNLIRYGVSCHEGDARLLQDVLKRQEQYQP